MGAVDGQLNVWPDSQRQPYVGVSEAGLNFPITELDGKPMLSDGTSNACALVSAIVAAVWSKFPSLTNRQVVARILATALDVVAAQPDLRAVTADGEYSSPIDSPGRRFFTMLGTLVRGRISVAGGAGAATAEPPSLRPAPPTLDMEFERAAAAIAAPASAGSFYLQEQSVKGVGRAFSGCHRRRRHAAAWPCG